MEKVRNNSKMGGKIGATKDGGNREPEQAEMLVRVDVMVLQGGW